MVSIFASSSSKEIILIGTPLNLPQSINALGKLVFSDFVNNFARAQTLESKLFRRKSNMATRKVTAKKGVSRKTGLCQFALNNHNCVSSVTGM